VQALSGSPKTLWLSHVGPAGAKLLEEVKEQSDKAWGFVIDRRQGWWCGFSTL
jgi:hypothetical protein